MDNRQLKNRLWRLLGIGAFLAILIYVAPIAYRARPKWANNRVRAQFLLDMSRSEALHARDDERQAALLRSQGQASAADQLSVQAKGHRRKESDFGRESKRLRESWW